MRPCLSVSHLPAQKHTCRTYGWGATYLAKVDMHDIVMMTHARSMHATHARAHLLAKQYQMHIQQRAL